MYVHEFAAESIGSQVCDVVPSPKLASLTRENVMAVDECYDQSLPTTDRSVDSFSRDEVR